MRPFAFLLAFRVKCITSSRAFKLLPLKMSDTSPQLVIFRSAARNQESIFDSYDVSLGKHRAAFRLSDGTQPGEMRVQTNTMKPALDLVRRFAQICVTLLVVISVCPRPASGGDLATSYGNSAEVPVTTKDFDAVGKTLNVALNFPPKPGTELTVIRHTGAGMIRGTFSNLANGQAISLNYAGLTFKFVANYHGGAGNDLVLEWTTDGNLSAAALTKLDSQLVLALKQIHQIAPFDKQTSLRPTIPIRAGDNVLVTVEGLISKDLVDGIASAGGQVVDGFVSATSARAMVPIAQLENLAARSDVRSISPTKLSVTSKIVP